MNIEILQAMVLVTSAFGVVVARDIPPGPDLEVDDFMIAEEKNVMEYWNYTAKLNTHTVRGNGLANIQCDFDGQYMEHPSCCYKFVQCSWTTPMEKTCRPGTAWSQPKLTCDQNRNTNCGPRPPKDNKIASVTPPSPASCSCGVANTNNRIIGGVVVDHPQKYPWQVGLGNGKFDFSFLCGGSIINNKYVLTAAHCFYENRCLYNPLKKLHAHIGEHVLASTTDDDVKNTRAIPVKNILIHPCFNCKTFQNDFALLELNDYIDFNDVIRPVCLPDDDSKTYIGELATVAGWGKTKFDGPISTVLLELDVKILDNNNCGKYDRNQITPNMLCAREPNTWDKNACKGDSGGPLVVKNKQKDGKYRYVQVGVVSFSYGETNTVTGQKFGCNVPGYPGVYSRVSKVLDWIKAESADGQYCAK